MKTAENWRRCVVNLQHATERMQATADAISPELPDRGACTIPDIEIVLARHLTTFGDYTVALSCLHALLAAHGIVPVRHTTDD
ncbi:hypothetical protein [Lichenicoccus sp.]|uniref:hypothetical protein n=1 Tax=Lichenicoccus sp. TaxID=2781899 RepID=UPI003D1288A7